MSAPAAEDYAPAGDFARTPPHDLAAEQATLGGMLMSKDAIADVVEVIGPEDHYRPAHQMIHEVILDLYARGEPANAVTVASELAKRGEIAKTGGHDYLHTLIAAVPVAASAGWYARAVKDRAIKRRLAEAGTFIAQIGYSEDGDADDLVDLAEARVYGITDRRQGSDFLSMAEILPPALDRMEETCKNPRALTGVQTGFIDLDALTHGLQAGQMVAIGARPALGKSTLGLDIARAASLGKNRRPKVTTAMFSLEMSRDEITQRMVSAEAMIPLHLMRTGQLDEGHWDKIARHQSEIADAPLFIDDSPSTTTMQIRAKSRRLKQRHGLGLIIVDYVQLMTSPKRVENRQQEVSGMSRELKLLAKELDVPVVAICQLNRGPEQRTNHKPLLADLRETGSLEQDSDVVILLHREDAYDPESPRAGEADFIVAKHRNGPCATIKVAFQGHYSRFADMARI